MLDVMHTSSLHKKAHMTPTCVATLHMKSCYLRPCHIPRQSKLYD